jgi:hypothetical protein
VEIVSFEQLERAAEERGAAKRGGQSIGDTHLGHGHEPVKLLLKSRKKRFVCVLVVGVSARAGLAAPAAGLAVAAAAGAVFCQPFTQHLCPI